MAVRPLAFAVVLSFAAGAVTACGSHAPAGGTASGPPSTAKAVPAVVASTDVYGSIAAAVGGDAVQVTSIINSPDADPHEYESTPRDAVAVGQATLLIYNGAGYDDFAPKILAATGARPATVDVAQLSGLQAQTPAGEGFNEHVWYSFPTVEKLADTIAADLGRVDPQRAPSFTANAQAFDTKINALTRSWMRSRRNTPVPGWPSPSPCRCTWCRRPGWSTPPRRPSRTPSRTARTRPRPSCRTPCRSNTPPKLGVPEVPVSETLPAGVGDYVTWMTRQVNALAAALDKT